jgi:hypothetical protein
MRAPASQAVRVDAHAFEGPMARACLECRLLGAGKTHRTPVCGVCPCMLEALYQHLVFGVLGCVRSTDAWLLAQL